MSDNRFVELMQPNLIRFASDLKAVLRVVEDPEVDDETRIETAGALIHVISSGAAIPGVRGVLRRLSDVLVIRLVLDRGRERSPEAFEQHQADSPELLEPLGDELEAMNEYLGDRVKVLRKAVEKFSKANHQGHSAESCVRDTDSSNWLYDAVNEKLIEVDLDEQEIARELKRVDQILAPLDAKLRAAG